MIILRRSYNYSMLLVICQSRQYLSIVDLRAYMNMFLIRDVCEPRQRIVGNMNLWIYLCSPQYLHLQWKQLTHILNCFNQLMNLACNQCWEITIRKTNAVAIAGAVAEAIATALRSYLCACICAAAIAVAVAIAVLSAELARRAFACSYNCILRAYIMTTFAILKCFANTCWHMLSMIRKIHMGPGVFVTARPTIRRSHSSCG